MTRQRLRIRDTRDRLDPNPSVTRARHTRAREFEDRRAIDAIVDAIVVARRERSTESSAETRERRAID